MEQQGWRIHAWGSEPVWESFARPEPGEGDVLIRVEACGIGLTVLNCIAGDLANDPALLPRVPGHELAGIVEAVGAGVDPAMVGQRVAAYFYLHCGACTFCTAGQESRCARLAGWVAVHTDGGYAPWCVLPARNAIRMPAALDPVAASAVPDAVATPLHVCSTRARIGAEDRVVVIGAGGGVGIHMVQMARLLGGDVIGVDLDEAKLATVERLGARGVRGDDLDALDPGLWGGARPTVVIDLVGAPATLGWSAAALGMGGRLVVLTTFRDRAMTVDPRDLVFREIALIGSRYASRSEVALAGELVASGRIETIVSEVVGPAEVPAVHAALRSGALLGRGALRWDA
jgi:D-arabinose 1-dehydrogenase-like Zn-dependent alcohol dehydrogenase